MSEPAAELTKWEAWMLRAAIDADGQAGSQNEFLALRWKRGVAAGLVAKGLARITVRETNGVRITATRAGLEAIGMDEQTIWAAIERSGDNL